MKTGLLLLAGFVAVLPAHAGKIGSCSSTPTDVKEPRRAMAYCIKSNQCDVSLEFKLYNNFEGLLPKLGSNQTYYEGKVGQARDGSGGDRRLIFSITGTTGPKAQILTQYFTADHYKTFCALP